MQKTVFISYSQKDVDFVKGLKRKLEAENIGVTIDIEAAKIGDSLQDFIEAAVRENEFTISVISKNSLQSVWVIAESLENFMYEKVEQRKRFLPIFIDRSIFDDDFFLEVAGIVNEKTYELVEKSKKAYELGVGGEHYDTKRKRLEDLRNNLSRIFTTLRERLSADFTSEAKISENLPKLIAVIKELPIIKEKIESIRNFFSNAGFDIEMPFNSENFIASPITELWRKRFDRGIYVVDSLDNSLDNDMVNSIYQKAKKHTNHALVVTNQQPKPDGWMAIASMRLKESHPFVLIPITDTVINEGLISKNESRTFANYIEKYLGKGYNPYDIRDPVFDTLNFFGREGIIDEILSELKLGKRVGLFGLHKIGKSSVLKTLQKKVEFPVAYVYLRKNIPLNDIYENILKAWEIDIRIKYPNFKWSRSDMDNESIASFESAAKNLLVYLEEVVPIQFPHLSIFLDEIETIIPYKEGDENTLNRYVSLMDSLRGLQQETESISLLVAGVHPKLSRVNYFWGSQKNPMHQVIVEKFLPPLDRDDCEVMVRSLGKQIGLDYDEETMEFILRKSGAHPYLARQLCSVAYQKYKEVGVMPFEIVQEAVEEFVYNPSRNDYFNDNALWGELAKEDIWGKKICEVNHHILRKLAASEEGLSKAELSQGIQRIVFEQSFAALKERSIINLLPGTNRYQITFELFKDWIHAHKLNRKEVVWQTHSISELQSRTTNLSGVGTK